MLRKAKRGANKEPQHQSPVINLKVVLEELRDWMVKYEDLLEKNGQFEQFYNYFEALYYAVYPSEETDTPQVTSEPAKENKWRFWKDRKGD